VFVYKMRFILFSPEIESTTSVSGKKDRAEGGNRKRKDGENALGHGRHGASAYPGARKVEVHVEELYSGDPCPGPELRRHGLPPSGAAPPIQVQALAYIRAMVYYCQNPMLK